MKHIVIKSCVTRCPCPCCGVQMDGGLVVCWTCFRVTDRLTPGEYLTVTRANVTEWNNAREGRIGITS